jgi:hypothetical protein
VIQKLTFGPLREKNQKTHLERIRMVAFSEDCTWIFWIIQFVFVVYMSEFFPSEDKG